MLPTLGCTVDLALLAVRAELHTYTVCVCAIPRNENMWKSFGYILVNGVPQEVFREVPWPKPLGPAAPQVLALGLS